MAPKDPTLATTPLDTLKARGMISDEAHSAATYFNALRKIVFGKAHPPAIDLTAVSRGGLPDELDTADAERKYREACSAIKAQSRQAFDAIENLVVHERTPEWMTSRGGGQTKWAEKQCRLGFAALLGWYRGRERKAA